MKEMKPRNHIAYSKNDFVHSKKRLIAIFLILSLTCHMTLSGQSTDSVDIPPAWYQRKVVSVLAVPSVLIGVGLATMHDNGFYSSQDAYECIQKNYPDFFTDVDDYLQYVPAVGVYGLNLAGIKGNNNFLDRSLIYIISFSIASITTQTIKRTTGIMRPDGSNDHSFPSGHTTVAFVSATFLHEEYKDQSIWYSVAGYSIATATGVLRMLNNRHWMSDVFVGAGIGILTTKAVYLVYPGIRNKFGSKDMNGKTNKLTLVPNLSPDYYGIYLQYRFN